VDSNPRSGSGPLSREVFVSYKEQNLSREFSHQNPTYRFTSSPVRIRRPFELKSERQGIVRLKVVSWKVTAFPAKTALLEPAF